MQVADAPKGLFVNWRYHQHPVTAPTLPAQSSMPFLVSSNCRIMLRVGLPEEAGEFSGDAALRLRPDFLGLQQLQRTEDMDAPISPEMLHGVVKAQSARFHLIGATLLSLGIRHMAKLEENIDARPMVLFSRVGDLPPTSLLRILATKISGSICSIDME
eukprot:scaffold803_cov310-Pinguiococcus_pyrenoidosus.AAC.206